MSTAKSTTPVTSGVTSTIEYNDPEIRTMQRQIRALDIQRRSLTHRDTVAGMTPVHRPDGTVELVLAMKSGALWRRGLDDSVEWTDLGTAPDSPAREQADEIAELERKIAARRKSRGGVMVDDDIEDLVGAED